MPTSKKSNVKKSKTSGGKSTGKKGGASDVVIGSPSPVGKPKKKK